MRPWLLFVPLKKQPRIKVMIEKCTEIGVGRMVPIASDRMEDNVLMSSFRGPVFNDVGDNVLQSCKLQLQSIEASEQCERLNVPMIMIDSISTRAGKTRNELCTVKDYLPKWCHEWEESSSSSESSKERNERRTLLICRERRTDGVVPVLQALQENNKVAFLVGPEGGWSAEEELIFDKICSKYKGMGGSPVQCISLGSSILRAETACMLVVSAWALLNDSSYRITANTFLKSLTLCLRRRHTKTQPKDAAPPSTSSLASFSASN
jgi:16S rRNA (uracil1498-N3)-methyltransferase